MIFPELNSIKIRRQKLGLRQKELSELAKVSQSLIAKIESENLSPSYDVVRRIFTTLDSLEHKNEKKCSEIMAKVITIDKKETVGKAIELMKKHSISQLPVLNNNEVVGSISESTIYNKILEGNSKITLSKMQIGEIMSEPFPIIRADYPLSVAIPLLKSSEAILLTEKHYILGIITKSNLF
jgi:predicted transcriptional regulator